VRLPLVACDYDDTLAELGRPSPRALGALRRLRARGGASVLVTGRALDHLLRDLGDGAGAFDRLVGEGGATLLDPRTGRERDLAPPAPAEVVAALEGAGLPLRRNPHAVELPAEHEDRVRSLLAGVGEPWRLDRNRGWLIVLPGGTDKASGLRAAAAELGRDDLSEAVGVGDGENDLALLAACGTAVAVRNAVPALREAAHLVTEGERGAGLAEVVERLLAGEALPRRDRRAVPLGRDRDGAEVLVGLEGVVLVAGAGGDGAAPAAVASALAERLRERGVPVHPAGAERAAEAALDRPGVVLVQDAERAAPADRGPELHGLLLAAERVDAVAAEALGRVDTLVVVGDDPEATLRAFCAATGTAPPGRAPGVGDALAWDRARRAAPVAVRLEAPQHAPANPCQ
jgi:hypothetical protein